MEKCIVIIILKIVFSVILYSRADEIDDIGDEKISDVEDPYSYLKSIQGLDLFSSTQIKEDLELYKSGLNNEDKNLNVSQLIRKYGYNVEEHVVYTADGYILTLIRIRNEGPTVFLMHGLLMSADDWVTAGPESGIAYLLANKKYDVWMGNARGTKHCRKHVTLEPAAPEFWNFTWDEIGRYDITVMIDYVLSITKRTQLLYIGHSQGATSFFVMCSEFPEYNNKISFMVALAPATAIPNMKSPFLNFLKYVTFHRPEILFTLAKEMGFHEFLPSREFRKHLSLYLCGAEELAKLVCSNVVFAFCGFDAAQLNVTNLPVVFGHLPAGASMKQIEHYSQSLISGKFRRFDYGSAKNMEFYGSQEPQEYQVETITIPISIFYSDNDWLVAVQDVEVLRQRLQNVVDFYRVPHKNFNHIDYMYAKDLKQLVIVKLLALLDQYSKCM